MQAWLSRLVMAIWRHQAKKHQQLLNKRMRHDLQCMFRIWED